MKKFLQISAVVLFTNLLTFLIVTGYHAGQLPVIANLAASTYYMGCMDNMISKNIDQTNVNNCIEGAKTVNNMIMQKGYDTNKWGQ